MSHLVLADLQSLSLYMLTFVVLCISCHLLQKETSLIRVDKWVGLWYNDKNVCHLLLGLFSRTKVSVSPLEPMTEPAMSF